MDELEVFVERIFKELFYAKEYPQKDTRPFAYTRTVKKYLKLVHRLVAEAFIPNVFDKETVNHIDCDKTNNHISNLEWMSKSENICHAYNNGLNENVKKRLAEGRSKTHPPVRVIETGRVYQSQRELSKELGLCEQYVSRCLRGGSKSTGGYHFEYVLE